MTKEAKWGVDIRMKWQKKQGVEEERTLPAPIKPIISLSYEFFQKKKVQKKKDISLENALPKEVIFYNKIN